MKPVGEKKEKHRIVLHSLCMATFEHTALYIQFRSPESMKIMIMALLPLTSCSLINQNPTDLSHSERALLRIMACEDWYFILRQFNHLGVLSGFQSFCRLVSLCFSHANTSVYSDASFMTWENSLFSLHLECQLVLGWTVWSENK